MDPSTVITPEQWLLSHALLATLWLFAGLVVNGAFAMLLSHAIIPSLIATRPALSKLRALRPPLYVIASIAFALAIVQFVRFVNGVIVFVNELYPRFLI